jgi:hypothetical protein
MDNEYEVKGLVVGYAIENQHGLGGKMPGACTIGGRYDNGYGADDKGDERTADT